MGGLVPAEGSAVDGFSRDGGPSSDVFLPDGGVPVRGDGGFVLTFGPGLGGGEPPGPEVMLKEVLSTLASDTTMSENATLEPC